MSKYISKRIKNKPKESSKNEKLKTILCHFEKSTELDIGFIPLTNKVKVKIEIRLKQNEEYIVHECAQLAYDMKYSATSHLKKGERTEHVTLEIRPSLPGNGSQNAYYISVVNFKTGEGGTYKVGILNVTDEFARTSSYFVKCLITPHFLWKSFLGVEDTCFTEVRLKENLGKLPHKKTVLALLPKKYRKLDLHLPKRPRKPFTARSVFFDYFDGIGVAYTYENVLCIYPVGYLQAIRGALFIKRGETLESFYSIPIKENRPAGIDHMAVRKQEYDLHVAKNKGDKKSSNVDELKFFYLFSGVNYFPLGELLKK
jgi:hypothetical protein